MFDYCVARLQMSEDEACRRIELARLARRFPALFPMLAAGEISLSVALVLKPILTPENHIELLAAARGRSLRQARELLAARFPRPDVPSTIRKLPEQHVEGKNEPAAFTEAREPLQPALLRPIPVSAPAAPPVHLTPPGLERDPPSAATSGRQRIEPLSAQRYKIQLTVDIGFKQKLEQARDLLRHAHPSGDLAEILSRALDLLIAEQLRRRFGAGARGKARAQTSSPATPPLTPLTPAAPITSSVSVPRASRREVVQRDGLHCTWVSADGNRCNASAWLEIDHRHPRGKGGGSDPENLRILCRAHNRYAAECEYGREHIERAVRKRAPVRREVPLSSS